jgi:hypothetical protein
VVAECRETPASKEIEEEATPSLPLLDWGYCVGLGRYLSLGINGFASGGGNGG